MYKKRRLSLSWRLFALKDRPFCLLAKSAVNSGLWQTTFVYQPCVGRLHCYKLLFEVWSDLRSGQAALPVAGDLLRSSGPPRGRDLGKYRVKTGDLDQTTFHRGGRDMSDRDNHKVSGGGSLWEISI